MALLTRSEIQAALERLGQLAQAQGQMVRLVAVGGAVMTIAYEARLATRDVDVLIQAPAQTRWVRQWAEQVAAERGWPADWLNDGAKGYLVGISDGALIFSAPGIDVYAPAVSQLLAMKLSAWRDDGDIADARRLLQEIGQEAGRETVWTQVSQYVMPGAELKARYAFQDLWEALYGEA